GRADGAVVLVERALPEVVRDDNDRFCRARRAFGVGEQPPALSFEAEDVEQRSGDEVAHQPLRLTHAGKVHALAEKDAQLIESVVLRAQRVVLAVRHERTWIAGLSAPDRDE